jgi:hypothetical protein
VSCAEGSRQLILCLVRPMRTSDWLSLAQTLILLGTGVVIYWYTRETQRLRRLSSTQAELLREEVEMMRARLDLDIQEQLRASKPFFRWHGGGTNLGVWTRNFYNEGAPISHLSISTDADLEAAVRPADLLQTNQQGEVTFVSRRSDHALPKSWSFAIRYRTRLDQSESKEFIVEDNTPRAKEA